MNKRQRKKREKKRQEIISKDRARIKESIALYKNQKIEVGDTVEIVANSYGGHPVGTQGLVRMQHGLDDFEVSKRFKMDDYLAMHHHVSDLKLIRKGTKR